MTTKKRAESKKSKLDPGLLAAHKAYEDAINTNDVDLVMAMYDPEAAQMPPDAPQTVGWKGLKQAVADYFGAYKTHWNKVVQLNWVSGEWGFDQGHDTAVDIPYDGGPAIHYDCKGILIYRRQPTGEWKVYRDIWNNNKAPVLVPQKGGKAASSKAEKPAKADKSAKGAKADESAKGAKADESAKGAKADKPAKGAKADKPAKADTPAKADKSAKAKPKPAKG